MLDPLTMGLGALLLVIIGAAVSTEKTRRSTVLALRSLWLHKLRSMLSMLGIIIGTTSVIVLMSIGEGSMRDALEDIKRLGATNIIVRSIKPPEDGQSNRRSFIAIYGLKYDDLSDFGTIPSVTRLVPMRIFPQEVRRGNSMHNSRVVATIADYAEINKLDLQSGRFLVDEDDFLMRNVCVLGSKAASTLFPLDDPIEKEVAIGQFVYVVIGVMKDRMPTGGAGGSQAAEDFNDDMYIPLQTARGRFGERIMIRSSGSRAVEKVDLHQITVTVSDIEYVRPTGVILEEMLSNPRKHPRKDWALTVPLDRLEQAENTKRRYSRDLGMYASISLLVGGIGIMNIMLATVTERTREIGIRRALGAKQRDIVTQFLIEAMVQTGIGGLVGVGIGIFLVFILPILGQTSWMIDLFGQPGPPPILHQESILWSLATSIGVGVIFGLYPAFRASRLDPIEALRHV